MSYEESAWEWVRWAWRQKFGDRELQITKLEEVTGVDKQRLYPMQALSVKASEETLRKIAEGLGVDPPTVETVLRFTGGPEKPRTPLGWVREAGEAIRLATSLLEREEATRADALTDAEATRLAAARAAKKTSDDEDSKAS